jgi:hypothetical protein
MILLLGLLRRRRLARRYRQRWRALAAAAEAEADRATAELERRLRQGKPEARTEGARPETRRRTGEASGE